MKCPLSSYPHPLLIRVLTFSQAVLTRATSLRASPASSLSLWASWLPFSSNHCCECCKDWSSSSNWTKKRSLGEIDAEENNRGYKLDSSMIYLIFQEILIHSFVYLELASFMYCVFWRSLARSTCLNHNLFESDKEYI